MDNPNPSELLKDETRRLQQAWVDHDEVWLEHYLVAGVEDPRINLQSILTRHHLIEQIPGNTAADLQREELAFAVCVGCLDRLAQQELDADEWGLVHYALKEGFTNVEGIQVPLPLVEVYRRLVGEASDAQPPNYVEAFLREISGTGEVTESFRSLRGLFVGLWHERLTLTDANGGDVLELACGSANDYRFLVECGVASALQYTGVDLCLKNIRNAKARFPKADFRVGNVFHLELEDAAFGCCIAHDLFEHLSVEGLEIALSELCRVTRDSFCLGFFQMHEGEAHVVRPYEDYFYNTLSLPRVRAQLESAGFTVQAIHIGTFIRETLGEVRTHNESAYTLVGRKRDE